MNLCCMLLRCLGVEPQYYMAYETSVIYISVSLTRNIHKSRLPDSNWREVKNLQDYKSSGVDQLSQDGNKLRFRTILTKADIKQKTNIGTL